MERKRIYRTLFAEGSPILCQVVTEDQVTEEAGVLFIEAYSMVAALRAANGCWTKGIRKRVPPHLKRTA